MDQAAALCRRAGFEKILLRGDTDFTQTGELDRWDADGVGFIFGIDAMANLVEKAEALPRSAWQRLVRPPKYAIRTGERARPENVERADREGAGFENIRLESEERAEFEYRPRSAARRIGWWWCGRTWRWRRAKQRLFDDVRYFFYITNDRAATPAADRGGGQRAVQPGEPDRAVEERGAGDGDAGGRPGENGAYMVMASVWPGR